MLQWQIVPYLFLLLGAPLISAALAIYAWRHRATRGATLLAVLLVAWAWWGAAYALELLAGADLPQKLFWSALKYVGVVAVPVTWLAFALVYTSRERWLTRRNIILLTLVPLMTVALALTNGAHHLVWSDERVVAAGPFLALVVSFRFWFWIHTAYSYFLLLLGTVLFARALVRSPRLYRWQIAVLLFGAVAPWVGNAISIFNLGTTSNLDWSSLVFTVTGIAFTWGLFRFRLFDLVPIARERVIEDMRDGLLVLDRQNRIADINPAAQHMFGISASQAVGQRPHRIWKDQPDLIEKYSDVMEVQDEISLGTGPARRDYDLRISPLTDGRRQLTGRLIFLHDITERKQAERTIADERSRLQALIKSSRDGLVLIGMERMIQVVNTSALQMLHLPGQPEDWIGRTLADVAKAVRHPARDAARVLVAETRRVQRGDEPRPEGEIFVPPRFIYWSSVSVLAGDTPLGRLIVLRDTTEKRLIEKMRDELTNTTVHDLRNPLSIIYAALSTLETEDNPTLSSAQLKMVNIAQVSAQRMLDLIDTILDISRLEHGQMPLEYESFSLADLAAESLRLQAPLAGPRRLSLENAVPTALPPAWADPKLIRRVLQNLIGNAIKFVPQGGFIRVTAHEEPASHSLLICVSDNGSGIPVEIQGRLFQAFVTGSTQKRGSGLGLAFCRLVVEAHGGHIWAESEPGQGTVFKFTLPFDHEERVPNGDRLPEAHGAADQTGAVGEGRV
jgi:PAS domain S-box-containing protein